MTFDITKVYTSVNADVLKPGCKVLVSQNMKRLKEKVLYNNYPDILENVLGEEAMNRFLIKDPDYKSSWNLAYLIEGVDNA